VPENGGFESIIGTDSTFRAALAVAARAARGQFPVLIEGECGSGKEILMHAMHAASARSRKPLHIVDIGAIAAETIEAVLFGCEKSALERRIGVVEVCDGGTLGIERIHHLPLAVQEQLAEMLTSSVIRPIGAPYGYKVDVRLIAASSLPLDDMVAGGQFLPELLLALGKVTVSLPPLRQRPGDLEALCRHFLARMNEQVGLRALGITADALQLLAAYHWPGNVRELQEALSRAALLCAGDALTVEDFPQLSNMLGSSRRATFSPPISESSEVRLYTPDGALRSIDEIEADVIRLALVRYGGRISEVARRLGIGRATLYRKLKELGLDSSGKAAE
jgi:DNA-binding NtrC family response regulator